MRSRAAIMLACCGIAFAPAGCAGTVTVEGGAGGGHAGAGTPASSTTASTGAGCLPKTCAALELTCGVIDDGCGHQLDCGSCIGPDTCGDGGKPGQCGCTPTTCQAHNWKCGNVPDGCGGTLHCGDCQGFCWTNCPKACVGDGSGGSLCGCGYVPC